MMHSFTASQRKRKASPLRNVTVAKLKRLAIGPWGVACSSFLVTALFIQADRLTFF